MNSFFKKSWSVALAAVTLASSAMGSPIFTTSAVSVSIRQYAGETSSDNYSASAAAASSDINVTDIGDFSVPLLTSNKVAAADYNIPNLNIPAKSVPETEGIKFVKDMRLGWNLGNTMDAIDDTGWVGSEMGIETCWNGGYKTSKKMIDTVKAAGFRTVRIPVSWHNHVDSNYQISKQWMDRVQEIVDYAVDNDMYVILNVHHDNDAKYMYPDTAHYNQSKKYMTTVWSQIAERFKDYDNKLIFETMNEPRLIGHQNEWWINPSNADCIDAIKTINKLNQDVLDTIRSSGGNNGTRYVSVPGYDCSVDGATNENFQIPTDKVQNRLIVAVHAYLPYGFALAEESDSQSVNKFNINTDTGEINQAFDKVYQKYTSKGIPVYVGEYGAREKGNNVQDRVDCAAYFTAYASSVGVTCCWWDDISFMLLDRSNCTWKRPEIVAAINKYARGNAESTIVTSVTNPNEIVTTTTSANVSESDKIYGKNKGVPAKMEADLTREKKVNIEETPESAEHTDAHGQPVPDAHGHEHTHEHEHAREHRHIHEQEQAHEHKHTREYMHAHGSPHSHGSGHVHSPEEKKRRLNRISRIIGHLEHVRRMIEEDYDCADILVQLSAVRSATNGLAKQIIHEHIEHCVSEAVESGDEDTLEKLQNAIDKFI